MPGPAPPRHEPPGPAAPRQDHALATPPDRPTSLAERGVAVPFTAPMLAGARLRRLPGGPPELLLPGLGGRGTYVLGWEGCLGLCAPTLHDRALWERIAPAERPDPALLRAAARATALAGYAGRAARRAAQARLAEGQDAQAAARADLLRRLGPDIAAPGQAAALDRLAAALAEAGEPFAARGRALEALAAGLDQACVAGLPEGHRRAAVLLAAAARLTLAAATANRDALRHALSQPMQSAGGLAGLLALAERPDWLLDGWDRPAVLWAETPAADRPDLLGEMLAALPVPPLEADSWPGPAADWNGLLRALRRVPALPVASDRIALVARNEALRSVAA